MAQKECIIEVARRQNPFKNLGLVSYEEESESFRDAAPVPQQPPQQGVTATPTPAAQPTPLIPIAESIKVDIPKSTDAPNTQEKKQSIRNIFGEARQTLLTENAFAFDCDTSMLNGQSLAITNQTHETFKFSLRDFFVMDLNDTENIINFLFNRPFQKDNAFFVDLATKFLESSRLWNTIPAQGRTIFMNAIMDWLPLRETAELMYFSKSLYKAIDFQTALLELSSKFRREIRTKMLKHIAVIVLVSLSSRKRFILDDSPLIPEFAHLRKSKLCKLKFYFHSPKNTFSLPKYFGDLITYNQVGHTRSRLVWLNDIDLNAVPVFESGSHLWPPDIWLKYLQGIQQPFVEFHDTMQKILRATSLHFFGDSSCHATSSQIFAWADEFVKIHSLSPLIDQKLFFHHYVLIGVTGTFNIVPKYNGKYPLRVIAPQLPSSVLQEKFQKAECQTLHIMNQRSIEHIQILANKQKTLEDFQRETTDLVVRYQRNPPKFPLIKDRLTENYVSKDDRDSVDVVSISKMVETVTRPPATGYQVKFFFLTFEVESSFPFVKPKRSIPDNAVYSEPKRQELERRVGSSKPALDSVDYSELF